MATKWTGRACKAAKTAAFGALALAALGVAAHAQDESGGDRSLRLELNAFQQADAACRMVFLAENRLGADLDGVSFETVLIDSEGVVQRLTLFDFKALPQNRTRVRQFDLDGTDCNTLGRILINGAASCEGGGIDANACIDKLSVSSRTGVEISG